MEILLGINVVAHDASAIEESNALALAIVPSGSAVALTFDSGVFQAKYFDPNVWEFALVTTANSNISSANERQLAGGLDTLTLNILYDERAYRAAQQLVYGSPAPYLFEVQDSFAILNGVAAHPVVQMAAMTHVAPRQPQVQL